MIISHHHLLYHSSQISKLNMYMHMLWECQVKPEVLTLFERGHHYTTGFEDREGGQRKWSKYFSAWLGITPLHFPSLPFSQILHTHTLILAGSLGKKLIFANKYGHVSPHLLYYIILLLSKTRKTKQNKKTNIIHILHSHSIHSIHLRLQWPPFFALVPRNM